MKGFLVFCGILMATGLVWTALPYLDERNREYEQRFIGALNFTEETIEVALNLRAGLYKPSIAPGSKPSHWVVSGTMVSKDNLGGTARAPFLAVLESVCPDAANPSCWRMAELLIDDQTVRTLPLASSTPETVAEGVASGGVLPGGTPEEDAAPAPAVLIADEATTVALEPVEATPAVAARLVEEAPASPPADPVAASQLIPGSDDNGGASPIAPGDEGVSKRDLIRFIQDALTKLHYEPGPIDGKFGSQTASAIRAYQRDFNLQLDGRPTVELFRDLRGRLDDLGQQSRDPSNGGDQPSG